jgi:hypothetical protein
MVANGQSPTTATAHASLIVERLKFEWHTKALDGNLLNSNSELH